MDRHVLDLRHNGGGAVSSLAIVAEFVLGEEPEHLATVRYRNQPPRQWWTTGGLASVHLDPSARVAVLIPEGTTVDQRTGTNWEGKGVQPHTRCPADVAADLARDWLPG